MNINELKNQGYEGSCDVDLSISLFEYGLIHKQINDNEYKFVYGVSIDNDNYILFDTATYSENEFAELIEQGGWFDINSILSSTGCSKNDWLKLPLYMRIHDCLRYYGYLNIFGDPGRTFEIIN
jgi:hypothetical protein